jgi:hypothetical protein
MVHSCFLECNIDIDLPFKAQNFNIWVGALFCLFKKNKHGCQTQALENGMAVKHLALGLGMSTKP